MHILIKFILTYVLKAAIGCQIEALVCVGKREKVFSDLNMICAISVRFAYSIIEITEPCHFYYTVVRQLGNIDICLLI